MKEKPYDLGYYNPIYREVLELLPNNTDVVIFDKFWHEYVARVRGNRSLYFQLSARDIERRTEIGHNHASKHIKRMVEIGILLQDGKNFSVAGDYVLSLLNTYRSIDDCDREDFRAAVNTHDIDALEGFGFVQYDGITSELKYLSAKTEGGLNLTQVGENSPERVKNNPSGLKITQLDSIAPTIINNYRARVHENYTVTQVVEAICGISGLNLTQVDIISPAAEIFSDAETISRDAEFILFILATQISPEGGLNLIHPVGQNSPTSGLKLTHRNIIKENNDENDGMPSASYIGGENDLKDKKVEELPSDEFKNIDMAGYSQAKLKSQLPLYTSQEIQEILNNPQEAITSNDKLFIRVLWNIAKEQAALDYDDQEIEVDVEGYKFPAERFQRDILSQALEETNEIIEQGLLSTGKENLPVELEELQPDQVSLIVDWETGKDSEGSYIVGSTSRFHKIYSEAVEAPRRKRGRGNAEERDKAKAYFRYILKCTDEEYDQLSDIEAAIYNFAHDFLEVNYDEGEVTGLQDSEDLQQKFISPERYTAFIASLSESGINITKEDFESVLNQAERSMTGSLEHIGETMYSIFSYEKIQAWIQKHGLQSPINI